MRRCELCGREDGSIGIHSHHVVGRIGPNKNNPENLIDLCAICHHIWHTRRTPAMENWIYEIMKKKHGDKFPIKLGNGKVYKTKWIVRIEMENENEKRYDD